MSKEKTVIEKYATVSYLQYTKENKVVEVTDYPDYIADEINLGFSVPFIKSLFRKGLLEEKDRMFKVTEEGEKFIEQNREMVDFFQLGSPYISIEEFEAYSRGNREELSFNERLFNLFEEKLQENRKLKKYVATESLHIELARMALELGDKKLALFHYMANLCYSVSGIKEYVFIRKYKKHKITQKELLAKYKDCVYVVPEIIVGIEELKDFYEENMVEEVYDSLKLGYTLCSRARFKELMESVIAGEYNNSVWQEQITDVFTKKMGFKPLSEKKTEAKKEDLGEPEQDESAIISKEDNETVNAVSDAKLAEIAEEESKK